MCVCVCVCVCVSVCVCTEIGCPENGVKMVFSTPQKKHSLYKKQGLFPRVMEMGVIRFCCVCVCVCVSLMSLYIKLK